MKNEKINKTPNLNSLIDPEFKTALDNLAEGFKICSPLRDDSGKIVDFVYLYVNDAIARIARLKKEDMEGHQMSHVLHGFKNTPLFEACCKTVTTGEPVIINNAFVKQPVADHEVQGYFNVRVTRYGENIIMILHETTENMQEIKQAKQQLQDIIDGAPALVFAKDLQGRFIIINKKLEELLGLKNEEIKGRTDFDIFPPMWAEYYQEHDRRIAQSGKAQQMEEESDLSDGIHHTFLANKFPLFDDNGEIYAVCGVSTDITEIKKTEKSLQKMAADLEKYAALFENSKWGIVIGSIDGIKIDLMNKEFAHMHGYTMDELLGRKIEDLFAPEVRHDLQEHLRKVVEKGNHSFESVHLRKDGSTFPVEIYSTAVKDANGNILFRAANIIDISDRKTAEAELNKTMIELERSNRELEQFAYAASHDLQEPLRMITSFTRMLELRAKDKLDEKTKEYMWYITDGAKRMSELIRDLLSYSRITTMAAPFHKIDLNRVISEVLRDLQLIIAESGTEIHVGRLPELKADRIQMKQLFQNLLQNAIKFRNPENSCVKVTAENKGGYWQFGVEDNGIGINPEQHERIFMLFQRLHEREKFPGTGIGLALCKKIVEHHGGRIWVESHEGQGSTFYFTIPA